MIETEMTVEDSGMLEGYAELLEHPDQFTYDAVPRAVEANRSNILNDFGQTPGRQQHPLLLATRRQQKFLFAFYKGKLPLPRNDIIARGWRVEVFDISGDATSITIYNVEESATFVEGIRQQRMHKVTGWLYGPDLAEYWLAKLMDAVSEEEARAWYNVKPKANRAT